MLRLSYIVINTPQNYPAWPVAPTEFYLCRPKILRSTPRRKGSAIDVELADLARSWATRCSLQIARRGQDVLEGQVRFRSVRRPSSEVTKLGFARQVNIL